MGTQDVEPLGSPIPTLPAACKGRRITFSPPMYGVGSPPKCGLSSRVLLNELKTFDKSNLSSCVTVVTREDGTKFVETSSPGGNSKVLSKVGDASETVGEAGFYVGAENDDNKPVRVVEGVYIGSVGGAKNANALVATGITHIVNCAPIVPCYHQGRFEYLAVDVYDAPDAEIREHFEESCDFIRRAVQGGGSVFVHCYAGVSRSAALVVAYLIREGGLGFEAALERVQAARPVCCPNIGFCEQLREFAEQLGRGGAGQGGKPGGSGESEVFEDVLLGVGSPRGGV